MAPAITNAPVPLGVTIPGVPPAAPVDAISDFERVMARNLRQSTTCGKAWILQLLDNPAPEAEAQLAALIADSGGRAIRENEAGLKAQLQATSDRAELYRRAVEAVASNAHLAPASYPPQLRNILVEALGRPY